MGCFIPYGKGLLRKHHFSLICPKLSNIYLSLLFWAPRGDGYQFPEASEGVTLLCVRPRGRLAAGFHTAPDSHKASFFTRQFACGYAFLAQVHCVCRHNTLPLQGALGDPRQGTSVAS